MNLIFKGLVLILAYISALMATPLKEEKSLITGEFKNGFKYTIKHNTTPEDRAQLRLLVKVGALEEDDDQKGIAHLVEHMAFNGTKKFKGNDLIKSLEAIGVSFGGHLNASTSSTETTYMLDIPLKDDNLDKALIIFNEWARNIEFTQKELDKERGVVQEEARARNDVRFRLFEQARPTYFEGSKLALRSAIGDMDIVKNISLERVKAFYDDWYRPEFMHFIAVGNFDIKELEKKIKDTFEPLENKSDRKRVSRDIPKINKTRVLVLKDKELTISNVSIDFIADYKPLLTEQDYKESIIKRITARLINLKGSEQTIKRNPAASSIKFINRRFSENLESNSFIASFTGLKQVDALKELTNMIYTLEKYGFSKEDFKTAIKEYNKANDEYLKSLEKKESKKYIGEIARKVANNELFIDEKYKVNLLNKVLKDIKIEDIEQEYRNILKSQARLITYKLSDDIKISKNRVKSILLSAKDDVKKQKKSADLPERIKIKDLKPVKITKETYNKEYDFYEFILENGIKVVFKYNDYEKNKVIFNAYSKGGYSLYETKDIVNASYAPSIILRSGLDKYNILEVQKIYSDKNIQLRPSISRYGESIGGKTTTKDFEYLVEALYILNKNYRFDDNILENTKTIAKANLKKEKRVPAKEFNKQLTQFLYDNNERFSPLKQEDIDRLNKKDIIRIYEDRFSDFNNFTFIFLGDIQVDEFKKHISKYLGNLSTKQRKESYKYRNIKEKDGIIEFKRNLNNENISAISLSYSKELPFSTKEVTRLAALRDVLSTKIRELVREEKSGAYSVSVRYSFLREPYSNANIRISFTCDPKRKEELVKDIKSVIKDIRQKEVETKYVDSFKKKVILGLNEAKKKTRFWSSQLKNHYYYGDDLKEINNLDSHYKSITPIIIKETANKYFDTINILYTELNPKD